MREVQERGITKEHEETIRKDNSFFMLLFFSFLALSVLIKHFIEFHFLFSLSISVIIP